MMKIRYQLSETEFVTAHRLHLRRSFLTVRTFVLLTFALAIGALQAQVFGGAEWALRVFVALWVFVWLFFGYAYFFLPVRLYRRNDRYSSEQELIFSEEGIALRQRDLSRSIAWSDMIHSFENDVYFFLHAKHSIPIVIPKRALKDQQEIDAIRQFLEADLA